MKHACLVVVAVVTGVVGCDRGAHVQEHDLKLLRDRIWIDHMPRSETDKVHGFAVLSRKQRQPVMGGFFHQSMWEGHFEGFRYEQTGEELRIVLPQSGDRETLTVKPWRCNEGGMDYCLEITGASRGPTKYYSRRGWEIRSLRELDSKLVTLK